MLRLKATCALFLLLSSSVFHGAAQTPDNTSLAAAQTARPSSGKPAPDKPSIDKIDPPNWWPELPDPVLLVHGEHLDTAHITVTGKDVSLTRTQASANGHWCFLWLTTKNAAAQTLTITAANARGQTQQHFLLKQREHNAVAHTGFSAADSLYLIMTDRFADGDRSNDAAGNPRALPRGWHGGDFAGITQHIDYLKQLGITAVWLTPVVSNSSRPESYHGYAATDLYATDPRFGSVADYRALSESLHKQGLKLVIDLVPNHLGIQHPWVADPPAPEWFHGTLAEHHRVQYDFLQLVDPHAPTAAWHDITHGWFTDAMPDLNQSNPLVAQYLTQNAIWWIETANLDGIRLDTFPYVDRAFWHDYHQAIHAVYPNLTTVGEVFHGDPEVTSFFAGGVTHAGIDTGLDTPFDFPVYFTLRNTLAHDKPMTDLARILRQDSLYPHPERLVPFVGNHDTTRFLTDAGGSVVRLKLALGLVATLRGMPQIYSGDEIAMPGGEDPDDRHDFPGGFPGDTRSAFTEKGRTAEENEVFRWTAGLLHLRAEYASITHGIEENLFADADDFAFTRTLSHQGCAEAPGDRLLIVLNKSRQIKTIDLPLAQTSLAGCNDFAALPQANSASATQRDGKLHIQEPAESLTIFAVH
jgi:glycosidase